MTRISRQVLVQQLRAQEGSSPLAEQLQSAVDLPDRLDHLELSSVEAQVRKQGYSPSHAEAKVLQRIYAVLQTESMFAPFEGRGSLTLARRAGAAALQREPLAGTESGHEVLARLRELPPDTLAGLTRLDLTAKSQLDDGFSELCTFLGQHCPRLEALNCSTSKFDQLDAIARELPGLKELDLSHCELHPTALAELEPLQKLERLKLRGLDAHRADLLPLTRLPLLTELDISGANLHDAGELLAQLQGLTRLTANYASIGKETAAGIAKLSNLTHLDLSSNIDLGDEAGCELAPLDNLEELKVANTRVQSTSVLSWLGMKGLRSLDLSACWSDGKQLVHAAAQHPGLRKLSLNNIQLNPAGSKAISNLGKLEELGVANCSLDDQSFKPLGKLRQLKILRASMNQLRARSGGVIGQLPSLRELDLSENPDFGDAGVLELTLTGGLGLERVGLASCGLSSSASIATLARRPLRELDVSKNALGDDAVEALAPASNRLERAELSRNRLGNRSVAAMEKFTALTSLGMNYTQVDNGAVPSFSKLGGLTRLELRGTQLTEKGYQKLDTALSETDLCASRDNPAPEGGRIAGAFRGVLNWLSS